MNKKWISVTLTLMLLLLLAVLSRKETGAPETSSKDRDRPSLEVWIFFDQNTPGTHYLDIWDTLARDFDCDISLKTFATEELKDKLRISLACDELPDVFAVWGGTFPDFLFDADACLPVQEYLEASSLPFKESYTVPYTDGNNYIIPCLVEAYAVTFGNNSLMEKVGVQPPGDWDSLMELVEKTETYNRTHGTNYSAIELGDKDNWLGELLYTMIINRIDPYALDRLMAGELTFTDDIFLTAAEKCVELVNAGAFPDDFLETGEVESIENFIHNESLLFPHQSTITYYLMENMGKSAVTLTQFPSCSDPFDPDYASYLIDINHTLTPGLCISRKTDWPEEAARICLKFAESVNEINVQEYGYLNFMDNGLQARRQPPEPVTEFTSMVNQAKKLTGLWYSLLPRNDANEWRSLTKRLFAKDITPDAFVREAAPYLNFQK